jgi:ferredoxin
MRIIEFKDKNSVPTPIDHTDELCINCDYCVAVCPHGALPLVTMTPEQCLPVRREWLLIPNWDK